MSTTGLRRRLRVTPDPAWPSDITLRRGLSVAMARPWNATYDDASLRLRRGGSSFLTLCRLELRQLGAPSVFSPPLPRSGSEPWATAGFAPFLELILMRLDLDAELTPPRHGVQLRRSLDDVVAIDTAAFDAFWALDRSGLAEAYGSTKASEILVVGDPPAGFAIVGHSAGFSYLQRIAVLPPEQGRGLGTALVVEAARRARARGALSMFLNTQTDNAPSLALYRHIGFETMPEGLLLMRA